MNRALNKLKVETIIDTVFWIFLIYFYFINRDTYFFIVDLFLIIKILIKVKKNGKIEVNKYYFILFSLFFLFSSLLILFYPLKFNPLLFSSIVLTIIIFLFSGINFYNAKFPLLFLPFLSIIYYFIYNQSESSFIFKHSSLLGMLLIFGFILLKENKVMNLVYIIAILLTFSKTTYIAFLIILFILVFSQFKKQKKVRLITIIPLIFLMIILSYFFYKSVKEDPFVKGRLRIWKTAFETGVNYFPLGIGGFNFPYYTDSFKAVETHEITDDLNFYKLYLENKIKLQVYNTKTAIYEHNIILKLFTETGVPGLIFIISLGFLFLKFLKYYSLNDRLILLSLFFYSMLQNFTMNYLFLLPFISILIFKIEKQTDNLSCRFTINRKSIILILLIYFFGYSLSFFLNQSLINKNPFLAKRVLPFDIRPDLRDFGNEFNRFKKSGEFRGLMRLKEKGEKILTYNNRLKDIYSILSESFFHIYKMDKNPFFKNKTIYYLKKQLEIEPFSPFIYGRLSLLNTDSDIKAAKSYIFRALEIEPFFVRGLIELREIYIIENNSKNKKIINQVLEKIKKDKMNYRFKGKSSYERLVINEE